jgi:hypothetical protein
VGLALLQEIVDGSTDDGTLNANSLPGLLLNNALLFALLVEASPGLSPHQLGGLLALVNHALALGRREEDGLQVHLRNSRCACVVEKERNISVYHKNCLASQIYSRSHDYLSISSDKSNTVAGIDSVFTESA